MKSRKGLQEVETKLKVFESNWLRKIMNIKWFEHGTEEVSRRSGQQSLIQRWRTFKLMYKGDGSRMSEERLPKQVLAWPPEESRRRRCGIDTWRRLIQRTQAQRRWRMNMFNVSRVAEKNGADLLLTYAPPDGQRGLSKSNWTFNLVIKKFSRCDRHEIYLMYIFFS